MSSRDYSAEMRALIDAETGDGPYHSRIVAAHIVAKLRANDPELLDGWLHQQAEHMLWQTVNDRDRSRRSHASQTARRAAFADAAGKFADGQVLPLSRFLDTPFALENGYRKRLADLTGADLRYLASEYERRAADNLMWAAFLRVLARRVGTATVAARYTEQQLTRIWRTQVKNAA